MEDGHMPLPPGVYGGDVIFDIDGKGVVVHGIEQIVHVFFEPNVGRSLHPKDAKQLAYSLIDAAEMMDTYEQPRTMVEAAGDAVKRAAWSHSSAVKIQRSTKKKNEGPRQKRTKNGTA